MSEKDEDRKADVAKKATSSRLDDDVWNEAVAQWLANTVRNTAITQHVEAWNGLQTALPALKKLLDERL